MLVFFVICLIVGLLLLFFMWQEANQNNICKQTLHFSDFPKSFDKITIFFISDIHKRVISKKIIQEVKGKADIVVIGGDLAEKGVPFERIEKNLILLKEIAPSYFVWGNNDYEVDYHALDSLMLSMGIKILDNTTVLFESGEGDKVALLGVDDLMAGRSRLDLALLDVGDEEAFRILVSHDPRIKQKILPEHKIRLLLAGHTHGGQIRFFNFGMYKKGGVEQMNDTTILISNGYGTTSVPLRLGAPPETHLITLQSTEV
ncbi:metallophosphoesterase [Fredinandcohnia humi]